MLSEEASRQIAAWAGRKLGSEWLERLSRAHQSKNIEAFDAATAELFAARRCTSDWRLAEILEPCAPEDQLRCFRDALWRHVAPAISEYTDRTCRDRVALYLQDLERAQYDDPSTNPSTAEVAVEREEVLA